MAAKFISILGKLNHAIDLSMKASILYLLLLSQTVTPGWYLWCRESP